MSMVSEESLLDLVDKILGADGLLAAGGAAHGGFTFNQQQLDYARSVAKGLVREDGTGLGRTSLNFMQAGTGTGKTLGYLTPLIGYAALSGRRVGVSTFSRALQKQVLGECERVIELVVQVTGIRTSCARRLGRQNFGSTAGTERMRAGLGDEITPAVREFLDDLDDWLTADFEDGRLVNSGLISDFLEEAGYDELPPQIDERVLGLRVTDQDDQQKAYERSVMQANQADIVIFNHAIMITNAMLWGSLMGNVRHLDAVVVDEADMLPVMASSMIHDKISIHEAQAIGNGVAKALGVERVSEEMKKLNQQLSDVFRLNNDDMVVLDQRRDADLLLSIAGVAKSWMALVGKGETPKTFTGSIRNQELWQEFSRIARSLDAAIKAVGGIGNLMVLSWSPVRAFPSLHMGYSDPASQLRKLWTVFDKDGERHLAHRHITFTSATLATPGRPLPAAMDDFMQAVGVIRHKRQGEEHSVHFVLEDLMSVVEPRKFGQLDFVLADSRVPDPFERDAYGIDRHNQEWLAYTRLMVEKAAAAGGRVLVLACSYTDVERITESMPEALAGRVMAHERGRRLVDMIKSFREQEDAVLVTPAGWEGLDLPGLIKHVVITRIPYAPGDTTEERLRRLSLRQSGMSDDKADGILMRLRIAAARKRLQQGMGRPVRKVDDSGTVWIADPRFPLPEWAGRLMHPMNFDAVPRRIQSRLAESIPARFRRTSYEQAKVLTVEGYFCGCA